MSVNFYASYGIVFRVLDRDIKRDLEGILWPLAAEIRHAVKAAEEGRKNGADWAIDDEIDSIESWLGSCFVIAQTQITRIVSHAKRLHEWHERQGRGNILLGTDGTRNKLLKVAGARVGKSPYTIVEGVSAFANYFKHRDEWPVDWTQLKKVGKYTAKIIACFGAEAGRSLNLLRGFRSLFGDSAQYYEVERIATCVSDWARDLKRAYEQELTAGGFLPPIPQTPAVARQS